MSSSVKTLPHMVDAHEGSRTAAYLIVAVVLSAITAIEVWISYIVALRPVLVPMLVVLSGAKFALVVMFYMHLKYDSRFFSMIFVPLLVLACVFTVVLLSLMTTFFNGF